MEKTELIEKYTLHRIECWKKVELSYIDVKIIKNDILKKPNKAQVHWNSKDKEITISWGKERFRVLKFEDPYSFVTTQPFKRTNINYSRKHNPFYFGKGITMILETKKGKQGFYTNFHIVGEVWWPKRSLMEFLKPISTYHIEPL